MQKGFEIQLPLIARLRNEKKVRVETLAQSGAWFKQQYRVTPATSVSINEDLPGSDRKTVWFNSRFYRVNLLWEKGTLRFRVIHLFNENLPSVYTTEIATSNECTFFTLPFVDGFLWSSPGVFAGLRFRAIVDGKEVLLEGKDPVITNTVPGILHISWPLKSNTRTLEIDMDERQMKMYIRGEEPMKWYLDLTTSTITKLPFKKINQQEIVCQFENMDYSITSSIGSFSKPNDTTVLRMTPANNTLTLNFSGSDN